MKALRINRFLSQAGLGSRRHVEELVRQGRVRLNGVLLDDLSSQVDPERDRVEVDGEAVTIEPPRRTLLYHKPRGVVCSFTRQGEAPCLIDVLPRELLEGRLFHVGRLDRESSGLLLLSDDGELAQQLTHPSRPVWKRYRVRLDAPLSAAERERFCGGEIALDGRACAPAGIEVVRGEGVPEYRVELREGRNRQIRRMMEVLGRRVLALHREALGPLGLGELPVGAWRVLRAQEIALLREAGAPGDD